ncbi:ATP-binding protein [Microvirga rosea]|uniref:ATP-binding protein n=1 Tax=Microvirga rosea TaxID=2715425 RepID=UPI001D0B0AD9|nr:hybrid sensor histidine kinase/response regulator [Microvirga rosea]MCB8823277.1 response regulator [Microvirga rosea]
MDRAKLKSRNVLRPLQVLAVASLLGPLLFFAYTAWSGYRVLERQADERVERGLDVIQEHTLKAFQTIERTIAETNEILRDLPPERIRSQEAYLQNRLRRTQSTLPQIEAIWVFDRNGHPLVSSTIYPVPQNLDNSDRDYFRAQVPQDAGTFIGSTITARINNIQFFVISQRRPSTDGSFNGIVAISVHPEHFREFYARISRGFADSFGLIRQEGDFLARYPALANQPFKLNAQSGFMRSIQTQPEAGLFTATSQIDGITRRVGYRKLPGYPVYAQVGMDRAALWSELWSTMAGLVAFGIPTTLVLFCLSLYALRRTESFYGEVHRRELAEAALKQAQRLEAVGHLTGGVAHDFNNLLMIVKGNAERLRRYAADERQKRSLDAIENAATRGANLTRQLLSFSRRQAHEPQVVQLSSHLPGLQDMLRSSLRGDIAIQMILAPELWNACVDLNELELAILNIAVNARDAMPEGGSFMIETRNVTLPGTTGLGLTGDFVALSISDTGCGIPEDVLARIFEPFFTTKEVGKGTGLGLSQVYGFARQSGGTAVATSTPGQGTTVTVFLPRTNEHANSDHDGDKKPSRRTGQGHILLVEDNVDIADVTRANLEELGYRVTHAGNAERALDLLGTGEAFDLVFSDIVMPGDLNGVNLARSVREQYRSLPILLTTGYSNVAQTALDEGFTILRKPYDSEDLARSIGQMIQVETIREGA